MLFKPKSKPKPDTADKEFLRRVHGNLRHSDDPKVKAAADAIKAKLNKVTR